uniref:Solute carrier family 15 member 2 n=1 Tax=Gadus morhua TaxID=8049 RepID=A0A8C5BGG1_GADMO
LNKLCGTNYPLSIAFIVVNEFCERFSYYGMRAVLTLYFVNYLHWDRDLSTAIYHAFTSLCYFTPVLGALIADSWLGKFKTIIYLSIVYVIGHVVKSVGAIPTVGDTSMHIALSMVGLILIAFGTGGIKPCVAAFGGDQFEPEQTRKFFSIFYMAINAGSVLSMIVTPILRGDVKCFGDDCYALAFGVPAVLMVAALVVFISGSGMYKKVPPEGNILMDVCKCIGFAIKNRFRSSKHDVKRKHWLDWAEEKYSKRLIQEIKMVLRVLTLYLPLPMFWALFDQQGSRWTLQATRMNMAMVRVYLSAIRMLNALLILIFVPIFDFIIYPLVGLCRVNITDQKMKKPPNLCYSFISTLPENTSVYLTDVPINVQANYIMSPIQNLTRNRYPSVKCEAPTGVFSNLDLGLLDFGASYTFILKKEGENIVAARFEDVMANNVNIAWQIPQYVLITVGEVMFSVTGLEFSYSQAPANMKSVLQAGWLLTVAFGNVIVLIVAEGGGLEQWAEFVLFACLLVAVCIIFSIMAYFYTYVDPSQLDKLYQQDAAKGESEDELKMTEKMTKL